MARELRIPGPDHDLVADLVNLPDPSLGDAENVCCAEPRHLRLYVAAWMLWDGVNAAEHRLKALREAESLYERSGRGLICQPRRLTTAAIVAEVLQLLHAEESEAS